MATHLSTARLTDTLRRHGAALMLCAALAGLAWPAMADLARPALPLAVLAVNVGLFLPVDLRRLAADGATIRRASWTLAWAMLTAPAIVALAVHALPLPQDLKVGVVLYALAPTAGSAVAVAAGMGLDVRLLMAVRMLGCMVAPASIPLMLLLLMPGTRIDALAMAAPLLLFVVGGALLAAGLRRLAPAAVADPASGSAIAVLGMMVVGLAAMQGVPMRWVQDPQGLAESFALALAGVVFLQAIGTLVLAGCGRVAAHTTGLACGHRNASLVWVALVPPPSGDAPIAGFLAMSILVSFGVTWLADLALRLAPRLAGLHAARASLEGRARR